MNYFVPPPRPEEEEMHIIHCKSEAQPKVKISYPSKSLLMLSTSFQISVFDVFFFYNLLCVISVQLCV